jgi:GDP-L-fucose synthase
MNRDQKIFVTGHRGMVGSALVRLLQISGYVNLLTADRSALDLRQQGPVLEFFEAHRPEICIMAAARVGGIADNRSAPADFLFDNVSLQNNLFEACLKYDVKRVIYLGSSCIYPTMCPQPMKEDYLLTGPLEPTNEAYALAKIIGLKMAKYFHDQYGLSAMCLMPCNLYGTNDHFDLTRSHVLSALVRRFVDAVDDGRPSVTLWGTGAARREFMHVDDLARAVLFMEPKLLTPDFMNVGTGEDILIYDLAQIIAKETGFDGEILWDRSKPDGMLRKLLDSARLKEAGFRPEITLAQGITKTVAEYRALKVAGEIA